MSQLIKNGENYSLKLNREVAKNALRGWEENGLHCRYMKRGTVLFLFASSMHTSTQHSFTYQRKTTLREGKHGEIQARVREGGRTADE